MDFIPGDMVVLLNDARDYFGRVSVPAGIVGTVEDRVIGQLGPIYKVRFLFSGYTHSQRILGTDLEHFDDEYSRGADKI